MSDSKSPGDKLSHQVKIVGAATMLLFIVVIALTIYAYRNQQSQNTSICNIERGLAKSQVVSLKNLVESSTALGTYGVDPKLRAFFHNSERQRKIALVKARTALASLEC
jgi:hypothetical protein